HQVYTNLLWKNSLRQRSAVRTISQVSWAGTFCICIPGSCRIEAASCVRTWDRTFANGCFWDDRSYIAVLECCALVIRPVLTSGLQQPLAPFNASRNSWSLHIRNDYVPASIFGFS